MRKILIILLFITVAGGVKGQTISVGNGATVNVCCGDTFYLPVFGSNLSNIGAIQLYIDYDAAHFSFDVTDWAASNPYSSHFMVKNLGVGYLGVANTFNYAPGSDILGIAWFNTTAASVIATDTLFKVRFICTCTPISAVQPINFSFRVNTTDFSCEVGDNNGNVVGSCNYVTGNVTQHPLPGPTGPITGPILVCTNQTYTYSIAPVANVSAPDYQWQVPGGATIVSGQGTTSIQVLFSSAFNAQDIEVQAENNCGESNTGVLAVTSQASPLPNYTTQSVITGGATTLTGSVTPAAAYTYTWTPTNRINGSASIANPVTTNLTSLQVYYCTVTNAATGCSTAFTDTVIVTGIPLGIFSATISGNCALDTINLNVVPQGGTGSYTYAWSTSSVNAPLTNATTASPISIPTVAGTYTFAVTVTDANNTVATVNQTLTSITILPTPVVATVQTTSICSGDNFAVTPTNGGGNTVPVGTTFTWSNPSVTGGIAGGSVQGLPQTTISQTLTNPTNTAQTATYTVTPQSGLCTGANFTVTVTVNPKPNVIAQAITICSGSAFTIAPTNGGGNIVPTATTYTWTNPAVSGGVTGGSAQGTGQTTISQTLTNPTNIPQSATYTVTPTSGGCPGSAFTITVTIDPKPALVAQTSSICSGAAFNIAPANGAGNIVPAVITYTWTNPTVTGGITGGSAQAIGQNSISQTLTNPTNSTQTATYTITPLSGSCTGSSFTGVVTVSPQPNILAQSATSCSGTAFSVSPANGAGNIVPAGTTYTWTNPTVSGGMTGGSAQAAAQNSISQTLTNPTSSVQTATYTVTPVSGLCTGSDFTITVNVNPTPSLVQHNATICSGAAFSVTPADGSGNIVPVGTTYTWTLPAATGGVSGGSAQAATQAAISQTLTNPTNTAQTVTYSVTPHSGSCAGSPFTLIITVDPKPNLIAQTAAACSGTAFTLTPVNGGGSIVPASTTYTWNNPVVTGGLTGGAADATGLASISQTLINPGNTAQTATYSVTPTTGGCTGNAFNLVVTINPTPALLTQTATICSGTAFSVSPSNGGGNIVPAGTTYTWTIPSVTGGITGGTAQASGQALISQTLTNPLNTTETATYTVTPLSGGCTGTPFTVEITVNPKPFLTLQTATICSGGTFTISPVNGGGNIVPAGTTYSWAVPSGAGFTGGATGSAAATINGTLTNTTTSTVTATYAVTALAANGCSSTFTTTITIDPPVTASITETDASGILNDKLVCLGDNAALTAVPGGGTAGYTYTWNPSISTTAGPNNVSPAVSTTYQLTITDSHNCQASTSVTINVGLIPVANCGSPVTINYGLTTTLAGSASNGSGNYSYAWTPVISIASGANTATPTTIGLTSNTTFSLVVTDLTTGCASLPCTVTVTVNGGALAVAPTANPVAVICVGSQCHLIANASGGNPLGYQYSWSSSPGTWTSTLQNPFVSPTVTTTYTLTLTDGTNPSATGTVLVTVNPTPTILTAQNATICNGTNFTVTPVNAGIDIVPAGTTYTWANPVVTGGMSGGSAQATGQASISQTLTHASNLLQTATYSVTPTSGSCVGNPFTVTITVNPKPSIVAQAATICSGGLFSVTPIHGGGNIVPAGTTYTWTTPAVTGGITGGIAQATGQALISATLTNPTNTAQTASYTVIPLSGTCPGTSFQVVVTVNPQAFVTAQTASSCSGSAFTVTPTNGGGNIVPAGTTYTWTNPVVTGGLTGASAQAVGQTSISQTLTNPTNTTQTATYTVTPLTGSCTGSTFVVSVTIAPQPGITPQSSTICSGATYNLAPANGGGNIVPAVTTYTWTSPVVTGGITGGTAQGTGLALISQTLTNPTNTTQTATYTVTPTSGSCVGNPFTYTITVNPMPAVITQNTTICSGTSFTVTPANGGGNIVPVGTTYTWTNPAVTGGITGGSAQATAQANISQTLTNPTNTTQTATYTVTPLSGTCAGIAFTIIVSVDPKPSILTQNTAICSGGTFNVGPTNGGGNIVPAATTYTWTSPAVTGGLTGGSAQASAQTSIGQTLVNPTNITQTASYTVTPLSGACSGNSFTLIVTVSPKPSLLAQTSTTCSGTAFTVSPLTGGGNIIPAGTTYTWTNPTVTGGITGGSAQGTAQANISQTLTNPGNTVQTATYTVTPLSGACPGSTFIVTVTLNPQPSITAQTTGICSGAAFTVSPTNGGGNVVPAGTTYTWTNPVVTGGITGGAAQGSGQNNISQTLTNPTNTTQTATYTVTPLSGSCTGAPFTIIVTVDPKPALVAQNTTICSGNAFTINPTNGGGNIVPAGTTYTWINPVVTGGITGGSAQASGQNAISQTLTNPTNTLQTATYTVTPVSGGCTGSTFTVTITVSPKPGITAQATTICSGASFAIVPANGGANIVPAGTTYTWTNPAVTGGVTGGSAQASGQATIGQTLTNPSNTVQTATYTVTPLSGSCPGNTFLVVVNIDPKPTVIAQTSTTCSGTPFSVNPTNGAGNIVPVGTTYTWTNPVVTGGMTGGSAQASAQTQVSQTLVNPTNTFQTATYTVTPLSGLCSGSTFVVTITVSPKPSVVAQSTTICSGASFTSAPSNGGGNIVPAGTTYTWTNPVVTGGITGGSAQATGQASISQTLSNPTNLPQTATYTVTPLSGSCPGSTFVLTVTVNPKPGISAQTANICSGGSFNVTPTNGPGNIVPAGTTYSWTLPTGAGFSGGAIGTAASSITGTLTNLTAASVTATYSVTATAANGCTGVFSVVVTIDPPISVSITETDNSGIFNDHIICLGDNAQLTAVGAGGTPLYNYVWNPNIGTSAGPHFVSPTLTTVYSVTATDNHGCQSIASTTITVGAIPVANCGNTTIINFGLATTLSGSGSGGSGTYAYAWTPLASIASGANTATPLTQALTVPTPFTLVVTDVTTGCKSLPCTVQININGGPLTVTPSATPSVICVGFSTQLAANPSGGNPPSYAYTWTSNPAGFNSTMQNPPLVSPLVTTIYTVVIQDGVNPSNTASVTVTVNQNPVVADQFHADCSDVACGVTLGSSTSAVPAATYNITSIVSNGLVSSGGGPAIGNGFSANVIADDAWTNTSSGSVNVIYTVVPVSIDGCLGNPFQVSLMVEAEPVVAAQTPFQCSDVASGVSLGVSSSINANSFNITSINPNGLVASAGNPLTGTNFTINAIADDAWTNTTLSPVDVVYTVVPLSGISCQGNPYTITLTINPEPIVAAQAGTICSDVASGLSFGNSSTVAVQDFNITNINSNTLIASAGNPAIGNGLSSNVIGDDAWTNTGTLPVNVIYTVVPVSAAGCQGNAFTVTLTINPEPVVANAFPAICSDVASGFIFGAGSSVAATTYDITAINPNGLASAAGIPVTGTAFSNNEIANDAWTNNSNGTVNVSYAVIPVSAAGCQGNLFTVTLSVDPEPVVANQKITICSDDSSFLILAPSSSVAAMHYNIIAIDSNGLVSSAGHPMLGNNFADTIVADDAWTNTAIQEDSVIYTLVPLSGIGCEGEPFTVTFIINPEPVVANQAKTVCSDEPFNIILGASTSVPAVTYDFISYAGNGLTASAGSPGTGTGYDNAVIGDDAWTNTTSLPVDVVCTVVPVSALGCKGDPFTVTMTINPEPVVASQNQGACSEIASGLILGASTSVAATSYNIIAIDSASLVSTGGNPVLGTNFTNAVIGDDTWTNNGSTTVPVIYTVVPVSAALCVGNSFTVTLNIDPEPTVASLRDTLCSDVACGDTLLPSTTVAATTYNIISIVSNSLVASAGSPGIGTGNDLIITDDAWTNTGFLPDSVIYTIRPVSAIGCIGEPFTVTLIINPEPVVAAQTTTICSDQPSLLILNPSSSVAAATYNFNSINPNGLTSSNGSPGTGTGYDNAVIADDAWTNLTSGIVQVISMVAPVSAAGCIGNPFPVTLDVKPEPLGSAGALTVCSGTSLSYSLPPLITNGLNSSFSWVAADNLMVTGESTFSQGGDMITDNLINISTTNQQVVYTVTPTGVLHGCVGNSFTVTITVNAIATANAGGDLTSCQGNTILLAGNVGGSATSGTWTSSQGGTFLPNATTINASFTPPANYYGPITLTLTSNDPDGLGGPCVAATDNMLVTVNQAAIVNAGTALPICQGTCTILNGSVTGGASTGTWSDGGTGGQFTPNANALNATYCPPAAYSGPVVLTLTSADPDGAGPCTSVTNSFSLTVWASPLANAGPDDTIPYGTSTSLQGWSNCSGCTYTWTPINLLATTGTLTPTTVNLYNPPPTFTLVVTDANNCTSIPDSVTITFSNGPLDVQAHATPGAICPADSSHLTLTTSGGAGNYTYQWNSLPAGGPYPTTNNIWVHPMAPTKYYITVNDGFNSAIDSVIVFVYTRPTATASSNSPICDDSLLTLNSTPSGMASYAWSGPLAFNSALQNPSITNADTLAEGVYQVILKDGNGCGDTATTSVVIYRTPKVMNNNTAFQYCHGSQTLAIPFTSNLAGTTYTWTNNNTSIGLAASGSGNIPIFTASNSGTTIQTAIISVTPTANFCPGLKQDFYITVYPQPVVGAIADKSVCVGGTVSAITFTSSVNPGTTYSWTNTEPLIGLAAASAGNVTGIPAFTATNLGLTPLIGTITVTPVANTCTGPGEVFTVTVNPLPVMTPAANQIVCITEPSFALTGATPLNGTYSGTGVSAGNFNPVTAGEGPHTITYSYTNANNCNNTCTFTITVNRITVGSIGSSQIICYNSTPTTFNAATPASAYGTLVYQWQNGTSAAGPWTNIPATNTATYSAPALIADTWYQRVVYSITNGDTCTAISNSVKITINTVDAGTIGRDTTICSGTTPPGIIVIVAASGAGNVLTNVWQSANSSAGPWTTISGATGTTYNPGSLTANKCYRKIVTSHMTGVLCTDTTNVVCIVVNYATASTIGSNQTICSGDVPNAFTQTAAASGPVGATLSYQWQQSIVGNTGPWTDINGATATTYAPPALTVTTWYHVVVTSLLNGISCTDVSNYRRITVNNVSAGTVTDDQTICSGTVPACFAVGTAATGTALTYQWLIGNSAIGPWSPITGPGTTNATYCPPALTADTWYCRVVKSTVSGLTCYDTTNVLKITVNSVLAGTIIADQTICSGTTPACLSFSVAATGTTGGTLSYQWQWAIAVGGPWNNTGTNAVTYCPPSLTVTTWYRVIVTNTLNTLGCNATTNSVKITINNVTPGTVAASQTICNGSTPAPFTVTLAATGTALIYQWQSGTSATGPWTDIPGATAAAYAAPAISADTWYRRIVKSILNADTCTAITTVLSISINNVTAGLVKSNQTICSGSIPNLLQDSVPVGTGSGGLSYQWEISTTGVGGPWNPIGGATAATYQPPALFANTWYRRKVISTLNLTPCFAYTNIIAITINMVTPGTIAADLTICSGENPIAFTVPTAATGTSLVYQWQSATAATGPWSNIALATSATYDAPALTVDTWYRRNVISTLNGVPCSATSNVLKITINIVAAGTIAADQTICSGTQPAAFTATGASGAGTLTYQWQNGASATGQSNIAGATAAGYGAPNLTADTWYQRILISTLSGKVCTDTSNVIKITINSVTAGTVDTNQTICNGSTPAPFTVSVAAIGAGALTYQWQSANAAGGPWNDIPGATSDTYAPPALSASKWYRRIVTSTLNNVSCFATSNVISITVNPMPISNPGLDTTICRNMTLANTWATASNNAGVSWATSGDGGFTPNPPVVLHPVYTPGPTDIANGSVILTMTANGIFPCGDVSQSFTLTISDYTGAYAGPDTTICEGVPYFIGLSAMSNATSVTWSSTGTGSFDNITILHPTYTPSAGDLASGSVNLSMHAVNTLLFCGDSTHTMTLTITPLPNANAGLNTQVCLGDSVQLQATGGTAFFWTPAAGLSADNIANPWARPMSTTIYTVLVSQNGCSKAASVTVTVYSLPVANAGPNVILCKNDATELTVTGGYTYLWSTGATSQSIIVSPPTTTTYFATVTDYHGCTNVDDVQVTVNLPPVISITPPYDFICRDSSVRLQATGASTYTWFPTSGLSIPVGPIVMATPTQTTMYTVTGADVNGCKSEGTVSIRVYPTPVLILPDSGYVCDGVPLVLNAGYNDSTSYQWQDGSTSQFYTVTDWGTYWVVASNKGCTVMDTTSIDICTKIWVPNAFTPDGNNINDYFYAQTYRELKEFHLYIFTRWGEQIFESNDINKGWDGTYEGQPVPMGVYLYVIKFIGQANNATDKEGLLKGNVNLIR